jgi:hypothetical protein
MNDISTTPDSAGVTVKATKMPVWELIFFYPTLFVAILGALPTLSNLVKLWRLPVSVPLASVDNAKEQLDLLKANFFCSQEAANHLLKKHGNLSINAVVCDSGDVATVAQDARIGSYPNPVIVPLKTIVSVGDTAQASTLRSLLPVSSAYAQQPQPQPASSSSTMSTRAQNDSVVCQRLQDDGNLLRRIKTPDGSCIDVLSNVYSRQIMKQMPAPCAPTC